MTNRHHPYTMAQVRGPGHHRWLAVFVALAVMGLSLATVGSAPAAAAGPDTDGDGIDDDVDIDDDNDGIIDSREQVFNFYDQELLVVSPRNTDITVLDPNNGYAVKRAITMRIGANAGAPSVTVYGFNDLVQDPTTGDYYGIAREQFWRQSLVRVDVARGVIYPIGDFGNLYFSTFAFDGAGQLYGVNGAGGSTLYAIDKTTAATVPGFAFPTNGPGETMAYNSDNGLMYRFSGNKASNQVMESFDPTNPVPTHTSIAMSGDLPVGSQIGAIYVGNGEILVFTPGESNQDAIRIVDTNGVFVDVGDYNTAYKGGFVFQAPAAPLNSDTDTAPNTVDLDSDNDGISDLEEEGIDPGFDSDRNGVIDNVFSDGNGDGLHDGIPVTDELLNDSDGDKIGNHIDLDSDNDGIPDAIERDLTGTFEDPNTSVADADGDGILDLYDNSSLFGAGDNGFQPLSDTDNDHNPDYTDHNSDNDDHADANESGFGLAQNTEDLDADGLFDYWDLDVASPSDPSNGIDSVTADLLDVDGDASDVDFRSAFRPSPAFDLDVDNDGILNTDERCFVEDIGGSGSPGINISATPQTLSYNSIEMTFTELSPYVSYDETGLFISQNTVVPDGLTVAEAAVLDALETQNGGSFQVDFNPAAFNVRFAIGDLDIEENMSVEVYDAAGALVPDVTSSVIWDSPYIDVTAGGAAESAVLVTSVDNNAGAIFEEHQYIDFRLSFDVSRIVITQVTAGDATAVVYTMFISAETLGDTDGDGVADCLDLDSDNDGISDLYESGSVAGVAADTDSDGAVSNPEADAAAGGPGAGDSTGNGLMDVFGSGDTGTTPSNSDIDAVPDYLDLDSDDDGIPDAIEAQTTQSYTASYSNDGDATDDDSDGDGVRAAYDPDDATGGFGAAFTAPVDTNGDTTPDYLDDDSDDDALLDSAESGLVLVAADSDGDGIDDGVNASYADPDGDAHELTSFALTDTDDDTLADGSDAAPMIKDLDYRDRSFPLATDDESLRNPAGSVTVDASVNDVGGDPVVRSTLDLDPSTPLVQTSLSVPGEGEWTTDGAGTVTFTPAPDFRGDPTPILYEIADAEGDAVTATITIDYVPVADDDVSLANPVGEPVSIAVTVNDTDGDSVAPGTVDLDPSTPGRQTTRTIVGQGEWAVDGTGTVTFVPEPGATGDPTPISYTVEDDEGNVSEPVSITITYTQNLPPVAVDDESTGHTIGTSVTVNVIDGSASSGSTPDSDPTGDLDPATVDLNPATPGRDTTLTVPGEGEWTVDDSGNVTFTPASGFTGDPTPIPYTVADATGLVSNTAVITIDYRQEPKAIPTLAFTGSESFHFAGVAIMLMATGFVLLLAVRRRRVSLSPIEP